MVLRNVSTPVSLLYVDLTLNVVPPITPISVTVRRDSYETKMVSVSVETMSVGKIYIVPTSKPADPIKLESSSVPMFVLTLPAHPIHDVWPMTIVDNVNVNPITLVTPVADKVVHQYPLMNV